MKKLLSLIAVALIGIISSCSDSKGEISNDQRAAQKAADSVKNYNAGYNAAKKEDSAALAKIDQFNRQMATQRQQSYSTVTKYVDEQGRMHRTRWYRDDNGNLTCEELSDVE